MTVRIARKSTTDRAPIAPVGDPPRVAERIADAAVRIGEGAVSDGGAGVVVDDRDHRGCDGLELLDRRLEHDVGRRSDLRRADHLHRALASGPLHAVAVGFLREIDLGAQFSCAADVRGERAAPDAVIERTCELIRDPGEDGAAVEALDDRTVHIERDQLDGERLAAELPGQDAPRLLDAGVVYGYFPAVSEGDDLVILDENGAERERLTFPRQRHDRHLCLADFFRSRESGETDVVGFQLVTVGAKISEATAELFAKNAYRDYLELHGLSVQLAEALAEYWHSRVRQELGFGRNDPADLDDILKVRYQGCRYAFGYPACPDLEDRATVMRLLQPERIGVTLSEEFQLTPEQSTDALIAHHPEARYFSASVDCSGTSWNSSDSTTPIRSGRSSRTSFARSSRSGQAG